MSDTVPELDLSLAINAVKYEYEMAYETATRSHAILRTKDHDDFVMAVAYLESFLVHARVLHEFFRKDSGRSTDLRASDFVPDFGEDVFEATTIDSINRALQHLTVYRQAGHIGWYPLPLLARLVPVMARFIAELHEERAELARSLVRIHEKATTVTADISVKDADSHFATSTSVVEATSDNESGKGS
jgi:hypothetical protein